ncbi:MAG TPA: hypothetical protein VEQ61_04710 [Thermoleophilaceae bacterium]|nr:hypothetical protein [Thermoleophilaceae bacterium]
MKSFERWSVRQDPLDRPLAELAVALGHVRAAAVVEVAGDGVVVVAVDRRDLALGYEGTDSIGMRAVADQVTAAEHALDGEPLNACERRFKRRQVGVDVGDNGDVGHVRGVQARAEQQSVFIDRYQFNR